MNTMKWLVRREMWEHKGAMFWAPVITAAITLGMLTLGMFVSIGGLGSTVVVSGTTVSNLSQKLDAAQQLMAASALAQGYLSMALPVFIALAFVVFFFSLSALSDERRDRSVLFWKSMPVSDGQTVASKAVMALLVGPAIAIGVAIIAGLLALLIVLAFAAAHGANLFAPVLATTQLYTAPLYLLSMVPVYAFWALPAVGWLMLVGALAPRKAFLWAIFLPVMAGVVVSWMAMATGFDDGWFWEDVVARVLLSTIPGTWLSDGLAMEGASSLSDIGRVLTTQSWLVFASLKAWIGALAGVAMLLLAAHVRRWKDEG